MRRLLNLIVAMSTCFVLGAVDAQTRPAPLFPVKTLTPATQRAPVQLTDSPKMSGLVGASLVSTEPAVPALVRKPSRDKKLFYQVNLDGSGAVPSGCLPYICDGGLRFDGDPKTPGWQEDSAWVGGYYGVGATGANGWTPTGEFRQHVIPAKVAQLARQLDPNMLYVLDVEHYRTGINGNSDATVEDSIRKLRAVFVPMAAAAPTLDLAIYGVAPAANYYACSNYGAGMEQLARFQRGEQLTDSDFWWMSQVAKYDRWGTGSLEIDKTAPGYATWLQLQAEDDRLTFGRTAAGKVDAGGGLTDVVTVSAPSCYDHQPGDDSKFYIQQSVEEARRINPGKPVYVFMWATYHPGGGSPRGNQAMDLPEWTTELDQAFAVADGVILWDVTTANRPDHVKAAQLALARARRGGLN